MTTEIESFLPCVMQRLRIPGIIYEMFGLLAINYNLNQLAIFQTRVFIIATICVISSSVKCRQEVSRQIPFQN